VFNAVVYEDPAGVLAAHDELVARYYEAGVHAWTVWVHPGDDDLGAALARAGHVHDGQPTLMAAPLDELDLEPRGELELAPPGDWSALARCNDAAYGLDPRQGFAAALASVHDPAARAFVALRDGEPVAAVGTVDHEGDCEVIFVATVPSAQGGGLGSELMRTALREARERGCTTTYLEATARGEPVYARLGYRPLGRLGMWELRKA
jgi:GNAT superfamily N-acetyltransferase